MKDMFYYKQSKAEGMTWKRWATCSCTSCAAVCPGKDWRPTRWKSATKRSVTRNERRRSRCSATAILRRWPRICATYAGWTSSKRRITSTWGSSSTICTRDVASSTMASSIGPARRWCVSNDRRRSLSFYLFTLCIKLLQKLRQLSRALLFIWYSAKTVTSMCAC